MGLTIADWRSTIANWNSAIGNSLEDLDMRLRFIALAALCVAFGLGISGSARAQGGSKGASSDLSAVQRLEVMRSKLESMRRSLTSAIQSILSLIHISEPT